MFLVVLYMHFRNEERAKLLLIRLRSLFKWTVTAIDDLNVRLEELIFLFIFHKYLFMIFWILLNLLYVLDI
jgi:hypothetical protein